MARERQPICAAAGCGVGGAVRLRGVALCQRHVRQAEWQLNRIGLTLHQFDGNILDLLDAHPSTLAGRVLADEARLARETLHRAKDAIVAGRIKVLELELGFARAQFDAVSSTGPAHKSRGLAEKLWQLQQRIDDLEAQIAKLRLEPDSGLAG